MPRMIRTGSVPGARGATGLKRCRKLQAPTPGLGALGEDCPRPPAVLHRHLLCTAPASEVLLHPALASAPELLTKRHRRPRPSMASPSASRSTWSRKRACTGPSAIRSWTRRRFCMQRDALYIADLVESSSQPATRRRSRRDGGGEARGNAGRTPLTSILDAAHRDVPPTACTVPANRSQRRAH
jgi:hypothetical protein